MNPRCGFAARAVRKAMAIGCVAESDGIGARTRIIRLDAASIRKILPGSQCGASAGTRRAQQPD